MQRFTLEQAQITIIDPKTSLIGRCRTARRAYAYTPDDIDTVLASLSEELRDRLPPSGLTRRNCSAGPGGRVRTTSS